MPTLADVDAGRVTLDQYEIAHGEDSSDLTDEVMQQARPVTDYPEFTGFFRQRGERGPQKSPVKERIGLRLNKNVVEHFRKTGPGWQSRINDVLEDYVKDKPK
ncbi:BrnA antitoxin family protein [Rhizobium sp. SSA_523]|uniref:BrnA antitoxin family protein n=1 Tax=Rhizobium sp. SSA_523 TaxID=2952477 RepID=UPI002091B435|nr:BrnA antitoxin family protein [Rhizobium sp. SSA_523]MCO5732754.1 BrnA antitoxin family protein [Rhizobium sp. SSA_523]WKC23626.1 BrnA antitoxin family protein [Rhizobium sp. SSA_523]